MRERPTVAVQKVWRANGRRFLTAWAAYYEVAKSLLAKKYPRWLDDNNLEELALDRPVGDSLAELDGIADWRARRDRRQELFWTFRSGYDYEGDHFDQDKWRRYVARVARRFMAADRRKDRE